MSRIIDGFDLLYYVEKERLLEENTYLTERLEKANNEINRIYNILDKLIEYIENHTLEYDDNIGEINIKELLNILKGEKNE